ncbi:MAG TPA: UDP-N-acetylmuramoyl-L-alanyl-D-glutamate--2,6-diaminopimelate ligase [Acidobacteriaceae bacterium]
MRFDEVLRGVEVIRREGPQAVIKGLEYDSRAVTKGTLFVAMQGGTRDGNAYVDDAVRQRAAALVTDSAAAFDRVRATVPTLPVAQVEHGRRALSQLARNLFNDPQEQLALTGVTGTNGKTTTSFLLESILKQSGRRTVLIGTIEYHVAEQVRPSPHTTPESRDLLELLAEGVELGATEAVMEVSSHALEQGRVHGLPFEVAIFTNLTRDHLDYHGTMDAYFSAKRRLFDGSLGAPPRVAVINLDDEHGGELARTADAAGSEIFSYGMRAGEFRAEEVHLASSGMRFTMQTPVGPIELHSRLTGQVNVMNLLAAGAAAMARGLSLGEVESGAAALTHVPGRFETVSAGQPFTVVVDYAHTDDALRNLLAVAREFVTPAGGQVLTLFGCGGDRDRSKRPLMGAAAGEGSDFVVLTSDNPRSESPEAILEDVRPALAATGTPFLAEVDRATAIRFVLRLAKEKDIVLIAGKGHEKTQSIGDAQIAFDDVAVAAEVLAELGYTRPESRG